MAISSFRMTYSCPPLKYKTSYFVNIYALLINMIINVRKYIIFTFYIRKPCSIDIVGANIVIQPGKTKEVFFGPFCCVFYHRAGFHNKSPVAALREQEFPRRLVEGPVF